MVESKVKVFICPTCGFQFDGPRAITCGGSIFGRSHKPIKMIPKVRSYQCR